MNNETIGQKMKRIAAKGGANKVGKTTTVRPVQKAAKKNGNGKKTATKGATHVRVSYTDAQVKTAVEYIRKHKGEKEILIQRELYFGKNIPIAAIRAAFCQANKVESYRSIGIWKANEADQKKAWKESSK